MGYTVNIGGDTYELLKFGNAFFDKRDSMDPAGLTLGTDVVYLESFRGKGKRPNFVLPDEVIMKPYHVEIIYRLDDNIPWGNNPGNEKQISLTWRNAKNRLFIMKRAPRKAAKTSSAPVKKQEEKQEDIRTVVVDPLIAQHFQMQEDDHISIPQYKAVYKALKDIASNSFEVDYFAEKQVPPNQKQFLRAVDHLGVVETGDDGSVTLMIDVDTNKLPQNNLSRATSAAMEGADLALNLFYLCGSEFEADLETLLSNIPVPKPKAEPKKTAKNTSQIAPPVSKKDAEKEEEEQSEEQVEYTWPTTQDLLDIYYDAQAAVESGETPEGWQDNDATTLVAALPHIIPDFENLVTTLDEVVDIDELEDEVYNLVLQFEPQEEEV
jgi:hypothetical protein